MLDLSALTAPLFRFFSRFTMAGTTTEGPAAPAPAPTTDAPPSPTADAPPAADTLLTAEQVFDSVGPAYEEAFAGLPTQAAALAWLVEQLAATAAARGGGPARVVDVGCGTGRPTCSVLAEAGHDVLGLDISAAMVAAARARVPRARFEQLDVRAYLDTNRAPGTLDAVTVFFSLIAGVSQADIRAILAGLARLLKPGGFLVFATVPLPADNAAIRWMGRPLAVSSLAPEDAVAAVRAAGLDVAYHGLSAFTPHSAEAGICGPEDVWEEPHLFVYAQKPAAREGA